MAAFQPGVLAFLERYRVAQQKCGRHVVKKMTKKTIPGVKRVPPKAKALTLRQLKAMRAEVAAAFAAKRCPCLCRNHSGAYELEKVDEVYPCGAVGGDEGDAKATPTLMQEEALSLEQPLAMKVEVAAAFAEKRSPVCRNHSGAYEQEDVHESDAEVDMLPEEMTDLGRLYMP